MTKFVSRHIVPRRAILGWTTLVTTLPSLAMAGGKDPDVGKPAGSSSNISNTNKGKLNVLYTQDHLRKISRKDLETAVRANRQGHKVLIEGFDKKASTLIFEMIIEGGGLALDLINDMGNLKTKKDRKDRLVQEIFRVENDMDLLDKNDQIEKSIFDSLDRYRRTLQRWARRPMQGLVN